MILPKYCCLRCEHEFTRNKPSPTECPICYSKYVKWLNYKEMFKKVELPNATESGQCGSPITSSSR